MKDQDSIWYLEEVDLYKIFCPHNVKDYKKEKGHSFLRFKKGDFIYFEHDESEKVYLVSEGKVRVGTYLEDGREITKTVLTRGEIFGEMALMGEVERKDFSQALTDTTICPISLDEMEGLMLANKELSLKIKQIIGIRFRRAERLIASLLFKSSRYRVIEYLYDLAQEKGEKAGYETVVREFFSHKVIGSLTATSRQTVTTVLNDLKKKNLINFDRKRLLIRDMTRLREEMALEGQKTN